ncbi:MAG: ATP-binding protein [Thermodesulfobacteriota bacterium]
MDDFETMKILVIDDEKDIREGCVRVLKRIKGCEVSSAPNGIEGLEVLRKEFFPVVLLDLKMPGMDGMDVLREIKLMEGKEILVIIITGFATVETAIEAMKHGAYDFIPKPFDPTQLRMVVERALDKIRLKREAELLAQERQKTLADLDTEKSRISAIVESLPSGVVVTNNSGQVVLMNPAFKLLLELDPDAAAGEDISTYVKDRGFCDLVNEISRCDFSEKSEESTYELVIGSNKFLMARGRPVLGESGDCLGAVVTLSDISSLRILDQLKSEFVAKVSHELRSPLSTIHEQLGVVLKDLGRDEESHEEQYILSRAKEKTSGLISLIGDLLDLSRIEAGGVTHNIKKVPLDELLTSIVDFLGARAKAKEQILSLTLARESFPPLTADPLALESIFGNLITNAINYTGQGGRIEVSMDVENNYLRVNVADNGFGIEERHHDKIFEKFYRVKDENTRFVTGTGLGLPIVKGLVDQMNGEIKLVSAPGKGTTFTVLLPFDK